MRNDNTAREPDGVLSGSIVGTGGAHATEMARVTPLVRDGARLAMVRGTGLLDSAEEPAFDRLTRLAVRLLHVPAAFFSLVDETRDFYKSACGLGDALGASRELTGPTFCHYAIQSRSPLIIPDTRADPVYREVPTVTSLGIAAYIGVPVVVDDEVIGSFCVIDVKPRAWTVAEVEVLTELAASAQREIGLRSAVGTAQNLAAQLRRQATLLETQVLEALAGAESARAMTRELEVERRRLADVFAQAPAFLAVMRGPDHVFALVNGAYMQLVGRRDVIGQRLLDALPELRGQGFVELLDSVLATGDRRVERERLVAFDSGGNGVSQGRYLDLVYLPLVEGEGERTGVIVHGTDVTKNVESRRRIERLLDDSERARADADHARAEAVRANRFQATFLGSMSHEFRTPLHAIGGFSQLLELEISGPLTEAQRDHVTRLQASNAHMLRLVDDMLDLAKLDAGEVEVRAERGLVATAVAHAVTMTESQATTRGVALIDETMPGDAAYLGDEQRVRQVFVNLLSNAIKFSAAGASVTISIRAGANLPTSARMDGPGPWTMVDVQDCGIGIPPESLPDIFEPFKQLSIGRGTANGGTGLGLAISRQLARKMGGDLTVESRVGVGSVFTLTLPSA